MGKMLHTVIQTILALSLVVVPVGNAFAYSDMGRKAGHCKQVATSQSHYQHQLAGIELSSDSTEKDCCPHCQGHCSCANGQSCRPHFVYKMIQERYRKAPAVSLLSSSLNVAGKPTFYHSIVISPGTRPPIC